MFILGFQAYVEDQGDDLGLSGIKRSVYSPPGLVLGGFRATSKVSSHNHEDPEEVTLECPFAIDNDEVDDYRSRYLQALKNGYLLITYSIFFFYIIIRLRACFLHCSLRDFFFQICV